MGVSSFYQSLRERFLFLLILVGALAVAQSGRSEDTLPFDPAQICRLSVDNIPRSVSIRQGSDVWFGYDLEKALVFKVWKAPKNKPGVILNGFKAESAGAALFKGETAEGWKIEIDGKKVPLTVRYLGCSQNKDYFELRWELSHPDGTITLSERISTAPATSASPAFRELRVESLKQGATVALPSASREGWLLTGADGKPVKKLTSSAWHQLSLR